MRVAFAPTCLVSLVLAGVAAAQAPPPALPAETPAKPFPLAVAAKGFAVGESTWGLYLRNKHIGRAKVVVTAGKPAGFHVETEMVIDAMGQKKTMREVFDVGADLALAGFTFTQESAEEVERVTLARVAAGSWNRSTAKAPPGEALTDGPATAVVVAADLVPARFLYLVLGRVPWAAGTRYALHTEDDASPVDATVTSLGEETIDVRGKPTPATKLELTKSGGDKKQVLHVAGGRVVQISPSDAPVRLVAGTPEECGKDLPAPIVPGEAEVRAAAGKFSRGFALGDADAAEPTIDFVALQKRMATVKEEVGMLTPEAFKKLMLDGVRQRGAGIPPEMRDELEKQMGMVTEALGITVTGDTAKVEFPGVAEPMEWAKQDGVWRLTWWVAFAGE